MLVEPEHREALLATLEETVAETAVYFRQVDAELFDGYQTAREVISHLVFWHRELVEIVAAVLDGRKPELRRGTFALLNAQATVEFAAKPLPALADQLEQLQAQLTALLNELPDWEANLPIKCGGRRCTLAKRVRQVDARIHEHLARLKRAERRGKAWVDAYYREIT